MNKRKQSIYFTDSLVEINKLTYWGFYAIKTRKGWDDRTYWGFENTKKFREKVLK